MLSAAGVELHGVMIGKLIDIHFFVKMVATALLSIQLPEVCFVQQVL